MTTFRIAAALMGSALALGATPASAQGLSPYGMWGEEQRNVRRVPPLSAYDEYYEPPGAYRDGYRYERRREREFSNRRFRDPRFNDFYYGEPDDGFDAPPPQRGYGQYDYGNGQNDDGPVAEGGARPEITPIAPSLVAFYGAYVSGSIVIDVSARKLYYVNGDATAFAYPIGVGKQGFGWTGSEKISRIAEWPDWHPPKEMRERKPELPIKMTGGLKNPLGARAIYLGNTLYRVHGTNDPKSIGRAESSGCFRMMNEHVAHLAKLAQVGSDVTVVKSLGADVAASGAKAVR